MVGLACCNFVGVVENEGAVILRGIMLGVGGKELGCQ